MAFGIAFRAIDTGVGPIGTIINVPLPFEAKAIIAWISGRSEAVDAIGRQTHARCKGFATSPTSRACIATRDLDAAATTDTDHADRDDCLIAAINSTTTIGRLDVDAINPLSVDFRIDEVFTISRRVHLLIVGGTVPVASMVDYTTPLVTGNQDVTGFGLGSPPDIYFLLGMGETSAPPVFKKQSHIFFGAAVSTTQRGVLSAGSEDGKATSDTFHYALDVEDYGGLKSNGTPEERADHVAMLADGFRQNWLEVTGKANRVHALAIAGGDWAIKPILTETDIVTPIVVAGLASDPAGGLVLSSGDVESVQDVKSDQDRWQVGGWESPTVRGAQAIFSKDAVGSTEVSNAVETDAVYVGIGAAGALDGVMDVQSRDAAGATFIMDKADSAQHFAWGIFGGPFTVVPPPADPTLLVATCVAFNQVDLTWVDNATDETEYRVERESPIGGGFVNIAVLPANTIAFSDTGRVGSTQYNYRVRACKAGLNCSGFSNESACTTPATPAGMGAKLTDVSAVTKLSDLA